MNKEVISNHQGIALVFLFTVGSAIVLSPGGTAKQDVWLAILLALVMVAPMVFIYARLLTIHPGKDFYDICLLLFGKFVGRLIALLYVWYAFHLGALVIRNFIEFINLVPLPETPLLVIAAFLGITCMIMIKNGMEVFGRWAGLLFPAILFINLCVMSLSLTKSDLNHLKPVLYDGIVPIIQSSYSLFSFPFAETVVFTLIFSFTKHQFSLYKVYSVGILVAGTLMLLASARNILVLGVETASSVYFPSYTAVGLINVGDFLQRIEIIISTSFLLAGIVKVSACLLAASNGVSKIFNFGDYRWVVAPVALLMINLSYLIYQNTMEMFEWAIKIYKYYAIPFQIILPATVWIIAEIRLRKNVSRSRSTEKPG